MGKIFYIADTHFSHDNIIHFCERPFKNIDEMDETLINNWNAVVGDDDVVIHLGDVFWRYDRAKVIAPRLKGTKLLIRGNHDWNVARMESLGFRCLTKFKDEIHVEYMNDCRITMAHRPRDLATWYAPGKKPKSEKVFLSSYRTSRVLEVVLCGHEHNNCPVFIKWVRDRGDKARPIMALNLSIEYWNYTPTPVEKVIEVYSSYMKKFI